MAKKKKRSLCKPKSLHACAQLLVILANGIVPLPATEKHKRQWCIALSDTIDALARESN